MGCAASYLPHGYVPEGLNLFPLTPSDKILSGLSVPQRFVGYIEVIGPPLVTPHNCHPCAMFSGGIVQSEEDREDVTLYRGIESRDFFIVSGEHRFLFRTRNGSTPAPHFPAALGIYSGLFVDLLESARVDYTGFNLKSDRICNGFTGGILKSATIVVRRAVHQSTYLMSFFPFFLTLLSSLSICAHVYLSFSFVTYLSVTTFLPVVIRHMLNPMVVL